MPDTAIHHPGTSTGREQSAAARGDGSTGPAPLASHPTPSPSRVVKMMDRAIDPSGVGPTAGTVPFVLRSVRKASRTQESTWSISSYGSALAA
jgi:hypothetical protein